MPVDRDGALAVARVRAVLRRGSARRRRRSCRSRSRRRLVGTAAPVVTAGRLGPVLERALVGRGARGRAGRRRGRARRAARRRRRRSSRRRRAAAGRRRRAAGRACRGRRCACGRASPAPLWSVAPARIELTALVAPVACSAVPAAERGDVPQRAVARDRRGQAGRVTRAVGQRAVDLADRARPGDAVGDLDALGGPAHDQHAVGGAAHRHVAQRRAGRAAAAWPRRAPAGCRARPRASPGRRRSRCPRRRSGRGRATACRPPAPAAAR